MGFSANYPWLILVLILLGGMLVIWIIAGRTATSRKGHDQLINLDRPETIKPPATGHTNYSFSELTDEITNEASETPGKVELLNLPKVAPAAKLKHYPKNTDGLICFNPVRILVTTSTITSERHLWPFLIQAKADNTPVAIIAPAWAEVPLYSALANLNSGTAAVVPLTLQTDSEPDDTIQVLAQQMRCQIVTESDIHAGYFPDDGLVTAMKLTSDGITVRF